MSNSPISFRVLSRLLRIWDISTVILGLIIAAGSLLPEFQNSGIQEILTLELQLRHDLFVVVTLLTWGILFQAFTLYSHRAIAELSGSIYSILIVNTVGVFLLTVLATLVDLNMPKLPFAAIVWAIATACSILPRAIIAHWLSRRALNPGNWRSFLLVGTNARSHRLVQSLCSDPVQLRRLIGYVDIGPHQAGDDDKIPHENLFLELKDLPDYLRHSPVDDVIVSLPLKSYYDETMNIIACCEEQGITAHVCADIFETRMTHSRIRYFADQSLITVASHEMHGMPALLKRSLDFISAGALVVLLSPIFAAAALAITMTSQGPIIFSQERVGLNKKIFRVFKFRTMVTDAEFRQGALEAVNEASGPAFKIQNDPRITTIGGFLRKFSIDELPQLFNVLRGEMSLVGPRPLPLRDYAGFDEDWHRRRLSVPPGITGLWQVTDRNHSSFEKWMKLDMQYIDQWSIWLDLKIIALTIPAVLRGSGR
jgi:exopolysaccharide biosynthesis polyprenyl glycosylphosphotransferase